MADSFFRAVPDKDWKRHFATTPDESTRRGLAGKRQYHKDVLKAIGLRRRFDTNVINNNGAARGALDRVRHLVQSECYGTNSLQTALKFPNIAIAHRW